VLCALTALNASYLRSFQGVTRISLFGLMSASTAYGHDPAHGQGKQTHAPQQTTHAVAWLTLFNHLVGGCK
jgi:hypothetical protein